MTTMMRQRSHFHRAIAITVALLAGAVSSFAAGTLKCEFKDKVSTATVTNDNTFQSTCKWECNYKTEGNDYSHKGSSGLNPKESFTSKDTAKAKLLSVNSKSVDCGGS